MSERRALWALLLILVALVFFELPGSWLIEPDEARYAEVPREMLARGDFVTPYLNDAHYFEKPPLLYWANAASMAVLGDTPFALRLPTRIAALGTAAVLLVGLETAALPAWGLWAAVIFLSSPLGFVLARYDITDGILTFALTLAFFALRRFLLRREAGERAAGALALLGAGAALAMLAKGLIGIVFPGLVFLIWIAIAGRWRRLGELLLSPAPLVFLALAAPWFILVQRANPSFFEIFFVREHFARFATAEASRPGPIYYFVLAFIAGFLPWTVVFHRALAPLGAAWRTRAREEGDALFFGVWFVTILVFFSLSHSKLLPYILPAIPAAAALAARALLVREFPLRRPLLVHAGLASVLAVGGLGAGVWSGELARYHATALAALGLGLLALGAWTAAARAERGRMALLPAAAGWAGFYLALILALPRVSGDLSTHELALAAARVPDARVVAYRCYPQSVPWTLRHPIAVAGYIGELGSDGERPDSLYWSADEFWRRWDAGDRMVVVVRRRTRQEFSAAGRPGRALAANRDYVVLTNAEPGSVPERR